FGDLQLIGPQATLRVGPSGEFTLVEALSPRHPPPEPRSREFRGRIIVEDGDALVVGHEARRYRVSHINGDVTLAGTSDIAGAADAQLAGSGAATARWDLHGLASHGLDGATGTFAVATTQDVDLAPLAAGVMGIPELSGAANAKIRGTLEQGRIQTS